MAVARVHRRNWSRSPRPAMTAARTGRPTGGSSPSLRTVFFPTRSPPKAKTVRTKTTRPAASGLSRRREARRVRSIAQRMMFTASPGRRTVQQSTSPSSNRSQRTRPTRRSATGRTSRAIEPAIVATCCSAFRYRSRQLRLRSPMPCHPRPLPVSRRFRKAQP